jgi:DNA-binding MarR family transcriptional regulator
MIAERLHCDPSNVTFLADRLEERGLVRRESDPADRRVKALALTAKGVAVRDRFTGALAQGPTLARLSDDEQRRLADLLARATSA